MDQMAHRFAPGVLIVRTGQPANFRNDDDVIHNVRVRERNVEIGAQGFIELAGADTERLDGGVGRLAVEDARSRAPVGEVIPEDHVGRVRIAQLDDGLGETGGRVG